VNAAWAPEACTQQTKRDLERLGNRLAAVPPDRHAAMAMQLRGMNKRQLIAEACSMSRQNGWPAPDRLARRQRSALICWYCTFCPCSPNIGQPTAPAAMQKFPQIADRASFELMDTDLSLRPFVRNGLCDDRGY
jgi:hypothetical protein